MSEQSVLHAVKRMNRAAGSFIGALGTVAGCFTLVISSVPLLLAVSLAALLAAGVWLWAELRRAQSRLRLSGGVIAWATLTALALSVVVSLLFGLEGRITEWTVAAIVLAFVYVAPAAILTSLLLALFARALFKAQPSETNQAEIGGDTRT